MSSRIPPSLKWLIDKRARLDAEVKKAQSSIAKAREIIKDLTELKKNLAAIDRALALHEIQVDPENISPIQSQNPCFRLPYGLVSKSILSYLRMNRDVPVRMGILVDHLEAKCAELGVLIPERSLLSRAVHDRLKKMARSKIILRHHSPKENKEGLWSIAPLDY